MTSYQIGNKIVSKKEYDEYRSSLQEHSEPTQEELAKLEEIEMLKDKLAKMDYKTSKYVDGDYTEEEWLEIAKERKAIRERIRELEEQLEKE